MDGTESNASWRFCTFGLVVTGKGEEQFLPTLLRTLTETGHCTFKVVARVGQRSPRKAESIAKPLVVTHTEKRIPSKDIEQIGIPARRFLDRGANHFVILVDDLEYTRRHLHQETFNRYRAAFDVVKEADRHRASVHFFVNMVEAYYFGDIDSVNEALGARLQRYEGDVEEIRHPKEDLKEAKPGFDEVRDGLSIAKRLDLDKVLDEPSTCASLRTLFKWCWYHIEGGDTDRFWLRDGVCSPVTGSQLWECCGSGGNG